uniref:Uncharacterized protein n=1 Tax=Glossina austeni TaxID=7395 RepID=A0A1A9VX95_GLOAU
MQATDMISNISMPSILESKTSSNESLKSMVSNNGKPEKSACKNDINSEISEYSENLDAIQINENPLENNDYREMLETVEILSPGNNDSSRTTPTGSSEEQISVDSSLRKALAKHKDQLENEMKIKWRHQQQHFSCPGKQKDTIEVQRLNDSIETKLLQFEKTQTELLQKIQSVSALSREVRQERIAQDTEVEKLKSQSEELPIMQQPKNQIQEVIKPLRPRDGLLKDVLNTQKQLHKVFANIKEQEHNVNNIICDSKLRLQQLEYESNQIEQSFLSYLERQKEECIQMGRQSKSVVPFKSSKILKKMNKSPRRCFQKDDNECDEEFLAMKQKLDEIEKRRQMEQLDCYSPNSTSSHSFINLGNPVISSRYLCNVLLTHWLAPTYLQLSRIDSKKIILQRFSNCYTGCRGGCKSIGFLFTLQHSKIRINDATRCICIQRLFIIRKIRPKETLRRSRRSTLHP